MNKKLKQAICMSLSASFFAPPIAPVVFAAESVGNKDTFLPISDTQNTKLRELGEKNKNGFLLNNLMNKGFSLNAYEAVLLSGLLQSELDKEGVDPKDKTELLELQNTLKSVYQEVFQKDVPSGHTSDEAAQGEMKNPNSVANPFANLPTQMSTSLNGELNDSTATEKDKAVAQANTPEDLVTAMSIINIKPTPSKEEPDDAEDITPLSDFLGGAAGDLDKIAVSDNLDEYEPIRYDELGSVALQFLNEKAKEDRAFYMQAYHNLKYVKQTATGDVPFDTSVTDAAGNYYQREAQNQYQFEDSIDIGFGVRVHKALDLVFSLVAENKDGLVGQSGTTWEFGNVLFKFHPERLNPNLGVRIRADGSVVSAGLPGQDSGIAVDTEGDGASVTVNGTTIGYTDDGGIVFTKDGKSVSTGSLSDLQNGFSNTFGKYVFGFGRLSLDFSAYTLKLSDVKAIMLGYKDSEEGVTLVYAKPQSSREGVMGVDSSGNPVVKSIGQYDRVLWAAQYVTKRLLPNMTLSFNYAKAQDKGELSVTGGAKKTASTVYSIAFRSDENMRNTQFEGELARSINTYGIGSPNEQTVTGNADYLDISHRFSKRLSGMLHIVNIDKGYDASSMVEDKTGDYLLTDNDGDGKPDYLYESGQKGFDLDLAYRFPENASLAFGISNYSLTTDGYKKRSYYLSGAKSWQFSSGSASIQQRIERLSTTGENTLANGTKTVGEWTQTTISTTASVEMSPWEDGSLASNVQVIRDNVDGNETRFDFALAHNFYPLERVVVTPRVEYARKKGDGGTTSYAGVDSSTLINSVTIGYEIVPDELTVNLLISKERYKVINPDINDVTGINEDGKNRSVMGMGIGFAWEPKNIPGLSAAIAYRRDKVKYYDDNYTGTQDVWDMNIEYARPVSKMVRATFSYDYHTAKDKMRPIYNEVTRNAEISIDATLGEDSRLSISHSYQKNYQPSEQTGNYTESTTMVVMTNKF